MPVSQVVAAGALMRRGILIKDGSALERLVEADVALFDKTGTLTLGRPVPAALFEWAPGEARVALALARSSRHPLSRALAATLEAEGVDAAQVEDLAEQPGAGVSARMGHQVAQLGRPDRLGLDADGSGLVTAFKLGSGDARLLRFEDPYPPPR